MHSETVVYKMREVYLRGGGGARPSTGIPEKTFRMFTYLWSKKHIIILSLLRVYICMYDLIVVSVHNL